MTIQSDPPDVTQGTRVPIPAALGSGGVGLVVYLATMNRTYGFIDKGELAAVATTLGIAHPTGYPTLTLIGHAATRLSPLRPVLTLNILACVLTATGVGLMAVLLDRLLRLEPPTRVDEPRTAPRQQRRTRERVRVVPARSTTETAPLAAAPRACLAAVVALCVGFTTTWWGQATGFEVYALQAALLPLVTLLFLRYLAHVQLPGGAPGFSWPGTTFAFTLGICFSNHMATVMLAPAFLLLYFRTTGVGLPSWRRLVFLVPAFLLGLAPYTYLLVLARMAPRLNWGNPSTLESLLQHVMGKQFQYAMKYEPRIFGQQTAFFWNTLANDTVYLGRVLAAVGIVVLFRRNRTLPTWTALLFGTCLVLSGLYDINDIGNYYLTAVMAVGIALAFGL